MPGMKLIHMIENQEIFLEILLIQTVINLHLIIGETMQAEIMHLK